MKYGVTIGILVLFIASNLFFGCSDSAIPTPTSSENNDLVSTGFSYPVAESPEEAPLLRWDFSGGEIHKYSFDLSSEYLSQTQYDEPQIRWETDTQTAVVDCNLLVESQGNGPAKLAMDDIKITWSMSSEDEQIGPTTETQPTQEIGELNEDGTTGQGGTQFMAFQYFFSLPLESLEVGESSIIDTQIPMNVEGVSIPVLGTITITLLNYMTVDGETCAHLKGVIDISDIQLTEELFESYEFSIEGATESLFSIAQNRFVAGEGQLKSVFAIMEKPSSGIDYGDYDGPLDDSVLLLTKTDERFDIQIIE